MAVTQNTYTGNGSTVLYSFAFPYLDAAHIKVSVNGTLTTAYTLANATTIQFNTAPVNGAAIRIYRETDDTTLQSTFFAGSAIRAQDLNDAFNQSLYIAQETKDQSVVATSASIQSNLNMNGYKITNLASPTSSTDAVNKQYSDNLISAGIADGNKGDVTVSSLGTVYTVTQASGNFSILGTGFIDLPAGTTAERPASPNSGMIRFNTSTLRYEGYDGSAWGTIGGGARGGGFDQVFMENDQVVTTNYSITTNKNAVSAGPVSINNGATVTVPSGSTWVIV